MADIDIERRDRPEEKAVIEVWRAGRGWIARVRGSIFRFEETNRRRAIQLASQEVVVEEGVPLGPNALHNKRMAEQFYTVSQIRPPRGG